MVNAIDRNTLEKTQSLEEAVETLFGVPLRGRTLVLPQESMDDGLAEEYDTLGITFRGETYRVLALDFLHRVGFPPRSMNHPILDVGCGSGLLALHLADLVHSPLEGVDVSQDMITLAYQNRDDYIMKKNASRGIVKSLPNFLRGSVYDLQEIAKERGALWKYIACRNALHRFRKPYCALQQMYSVLQPGGKLYLRDVRRDADWKTFVERIGEQRWEKPTLVSDYVGALAQAFTPSEVEKLLHQIGIKQYTLTDGCYYTPDQQKLSDIGNGIHTLKEYASEVEYVCIVRKD